MSSRDSLLDTLAKYNEWDGISPERLIPLLEAATFVTVPDETVLFTQFHPATDFYLLGSGVALHSGTNEERRDQVPFGPSDWPFAALGWSGFLPPHRYGTTVIAHGELELLRWSHADLARAFYSDPELSVRFFDLVLDSVRRQLTSLRRQRLDESRLCIDPPVRETLRSPRPVVGNAENCLRRSAFFGSFDEDSVAALAEAAELESYDPGELVVRQDAATDGLLLIASGRCNIHFEHDDDLGRLLPFRRFHNRVGLIAGVPASGAGFVAEASVYAESHCWVYRLPAAAISDLVRRDPEFGRMFQQRLLARLAGLIGAVRIVHDGATPDAEVSAVGSLIANNQTRLPVTSELHKVPHLLRNRLTVGNALAVLKSVAQAGRYGERLIATQCHELTAPLAAEHAFYRGILDTVDAVMSADETLDPAEVRRLCDEKTASAFAHLDCRVHGADRLPASGGNVFILNHLSCPEYYELPNYYHFSFDTAFVSWIVWKHYRTSAVRVVRESPRAEFGHNLFYQRLGHITVPTIESGRDDPDAGSLARARRAAGERLTKEGRGVLSTGRNLVICPEGQSQPAELSPARLHTGAFRLALAAGARIVPVALAGFHRRYKDGPLVAHIGEPFDVAEAMQSGGFDELRPFVDDFRERFAKQVATAAALAVGPAHLDPGVDAGRPGH